MRSLVLLAMLGCSSAAPPPAKQTLPSPPPNELTPALEALRPLLGDWEGEDVTLHAFAVAGAIYVGAFHAEAIDALIFDDGDGPKADAVLRMLAVSPTADPMAFEQDRSPAGRLTFVGGQSTKFGFNFLDDALTVYANEIPLAFHRITGAAAPELEVADLAFAKDTAARGVAGWVAAFDREGMMVRKGERLIGSAAVGEAIEPVLASGKLVWAPVASRRNGAVGFTVGKATHSGNENWKSTYITMWKQQPDGSWKVLLDTGRPVQE